MKAGSGGLDIWELRELCQVIGIDFVAFMCRIDKDLKSDLNHAKGGWAAMKAKKPITGHSDVALVSLRYYKMHIQNYQGYPDCAFRQKQLERVEKAEQGIKDLQLRGSLEK